MKIFNLLPWAYVHGVGGWVGAGWIAAAYQLPQKLLHFIYPFSNAM